MCGGAEDQILIEPQQLRVCQRPIISQQYSFLGLPNYYQIFISNKHDLRAPLNELLKKKKKKLRVWTTECQCIRKNKENSNVGLVSDTITRI